MNWTGGSLQRHSKGNIINQNRDRLRSAMIQMRQISPTKDLLPPFPPDYWREKALNKDQNSRIPDNQNILDELQTNSPAVCCLKSSCFGQNDIANRVPQSNEEDRHMSSGSVEPFHDSNQEKSSAKDFDSHDSSWLSAESVASIVVSHAVFDQRKQVLLSKQDWASIRHSRPIRSFCAKRRPSSICIHHGKAQRISARPRHQNVRNFGTNVETDTVITHASLVSSSVFRVRIGTDAVESTSLSMAEDDCVAYQMSSPDSDKSFLVDSYESLYHKTPGQIANNSQMFSESTLPASQMPCLKAGRWLQDFPVCGQDGQERYGEAEVSIVSPWLIGDRFCNFDKHATFATEPAAQIQGLVALKEPMSGQNARILTQLTQRGTNNCQLPLGHRSAISSPFATCRPKTYATSIHTINASAAINARQIINWRPLSPKTPNPTNSDHKRLRHAGRIAGQDQCLLHTNQPSAPAVELDRPKQMSRVFFEARESGSLMSVDNVIGTGDNEDITWRKFVFGRSDEEDLTFSKSALGHSATILHASTSSDVFSTLGTAATSVFAGLS